MLGAIHAQCMRRSRGLLQPSLLQLLRQPFSANTNSHPASDTTSYLQNTSNFLKGKKINETLVQDAIAIAQTEIAPISDARGTEAYKRLLLGQLMKAHFMELFQLHQIV